MSIIPFRRRLITYRFFNANYFIIGANLLVFMILLVVPDLTSYLALTPLGFFDFHEYWQLLSFHLVHLDLMTLVFNLLGLFFFGSQVEREMGSVEYLLFYCGIGIVSGFLSVVIFNAVGLGSLPIYGSTTTVFGVLLAYAAFYPDSVIYLMGIVPLRAPFLILIFIGLAIIMIVFSARWSNLVNMIGLVVSYIYIYIRYRTNPFRNLFS